MFDVGDEIELVDDRPWTGGQPFDLKKGARFSVLKLWPAGVLIALGMVGDCDAISIGVNRSWIWPKSRPPFSNDIWPAFRFRRIERRVDRAELYARIGIGRLLDAERAV